MGPLHHRDLSRKARVGAALLVGCIAGVFTVALSLVVNPVYAAIVAGGVVGLAACAFARFVLHWPLRHWPRRLP